MKPDILSPNVRKPAYAAYALLGVAIGATQVGYSAAEAGQPTWLTVTLAVYAFVGGALGFTAASNTDTTTHSSLPGNWAEADSDDVIPDEDEGDDNYTDIEPIPDESPEALAAAELDETPPPEDYSPRH